MRQHYSHWTLDERCRLCGLLEMGQGVEEIARRLNRHRSTVYREVARNGRVEAQPELDRDCQEFRVRAGIVGKKETPHAPTQTTRDRRHAA